MNGHIVASVAGSFFLVLLLTTLLLPGRQTPSVLKEFFAGAAKLTNASLGK